MIDPETGLYRVTDGNENLGSIYPDFTGGWSNTFKIGNFDLSVLLDFSKGGHYFQLLICGVCILVCWKSLRPTVFVKWYLAARSYR